MASRATQYRAVAPALVGQRGETPHRAALARATVRRNGRRAIDVQLHDISIYGCRVACRVPQPVGERIWVRLADGAPIAATIMSSNEGFIACRFDVPIASAVVRGLTIGLALV